MTAISLCGLNVSFGGQPVLHNLDLDVAQGGPTVLLGRSGSGKTTLLRAINRLNECLPGCETSGSVRVSLGGRMLDAYGPDMRPETLRTCVGMVFQTPNPLPVGIAENIALPLALAHGLRGAEIAARIEASLREAGLWDEVKDRLEAPAALLSGGQQQRLCLARALAARPEVLLLDEPTASLDYQAARGIEELLLELASRYTLLVVSHGLNQARRLARNVFVLREGTALEAVGRELLTDPEGFSHLMDELF
jgi:phosphate transport system ATP-binding protein